MPALFALALHNSIHSADMQLAGGEHIMCFLDDLYLVTTRNRVLEAFETVAHEVQSGTGIRTHMGKLQMWCRSGASAPEEVEALNTPDHTIWKADLDDEYNGMLFLGTLLGHESFIKRHAELRIEGEQLLLDELCQLEDIQCAWTLFTWSAVPRSNHIARVVPPSMSESYAQEHENRIWNCFCKIMGTSDLVGDRTARMIVSAPGRLGGLGL